MAESSDAIEQGVTAVGMRALDEHAFADPCPDHPDGRASGVHCCVGGDLHEATIEDAIRHTYAAAMSAMFAEEVRLTFEADFGPGWGESHG